MFQGCSHSPGADGCGVGCCCLLPLQHVVQGVQTPTTTCPGSSQFPCDHVAMWSVPICCSGFYKNSIEAATPSMVDIFQMLWTSLVNWASILFLVPLTIWKKKWKSWRFHTKIKHWHWRGKDLFVAVTSRQSTVHERRIIIEGNT